MTTPLVGNITYGGRKGPPDQAQRRIDLKIKDQHGRAIHVVFDRMPGAGPIVSYCLFQAPFMPDAQRYLRFEGDAVPTACGWDYDAMLADNRKAWDDFFNEFRTIATRMPGVDAMAAYEAATRGEWSKVPPAVLAEVGIQPEPDDFIKACMANNRWVLGFDPNVPSWAVPLLSLKRARERRRTETDDLDKYRDNPYTDAETAADVDDGAEAAGLTGGTQRIGRKRGKDAA